MCLQAIPWIKSLLARAHAPTILIIGMTRVTIAEFEG